MTNPNICPNICGALVRTRWGRSMSCSVAKGGWEVRWRDCRRAAALAAVQDRGGGARVFDECAHRGHEPLERGSRDHGHGAPGLASIPTRPQQGTRWRYVVRRSTARKRASVASPARGRRGMPPALVEQSRARRAPPHARRPLAAGGRRWLRSVDARTSSRTPGAPMRSMGVSAWCRCSASMPLEQTRASRTSAAWIERQAELVEAGEVAAKTVNNTLGTLVVCLNAAVKDRVIARNPALGIERLPAAHIEHDYLRLHEIPLYLDCCVDVVPPARGGAGRRRPAYLRGARAADRRPRARADGRPGHRVYRSHKKSPRRQIGSTKSDRFRCVEIGPGLSRVLAISSHAAPRWTRERLETLRRVRDAGPRPQSSIAGGGPAPAARRR